MSIEILPLVLLMFFHFVCDFILQKPSWAKNKSNSSKELFKHVSMYTLIFIIPCLIFSFNLIQIVSFLLITFQLHFIIDEYTSKITSNQFKELNNQKDSLPNFGPFTTIGFDQFLHFISLVFTYYFITHI